MRVVLICVDDRWWPSGPRFWDVTDGCGGSVWFSGAGGGSLSIHARYWLSVRGSCGVPQISR